MNCIIPAPQAILEVAAPTSIYALFRYLRSLSELEIVGMSDGQLSLFQLVLSHPVQLFCCRHRLVFELRENQSRRVFNGAHEESPPVPKKHFEYLLSIASVFVLYSLLFFNVTTYYTQCDCLLRQTSDRRCPTWPPHHTHYDEQRSSRWAENSPIERSSNQVSLC